jgi:hypothetical protein
VLFALFALSGFCGLIYESIWAYYLKLFVGHAAYAQTVVLVVFIGSMASGAGPPAARPATPARLRHRRSHRRPLRSPSSGFSPPPPTGPTPLLPALFRRRHLRLAPRRPAHPAAVDLLGTTFR